ncbi:hypothetical protein [Orrella sp. 11846]|uniref:hypothetical protein n=1 Tax=Orrella sp. 11846 TaxID=3409913 RepID=UPI003B5B316C
MDMEWDDWYMILQDLAAKHRENVSDADAWREPFDAGQSPEEAFYDEYPEHKG